MSYHAAHTQRGLLIAAQSIAAIGAVVVGLIAINGNLVSYAGIIAALITLASVLVVLRTGAMTSRVSLEDGVLDVVHGDNRHRFDLTSDSTTVDVVGDPGRLGVDDDAGPPRPVSSRDHLTPGRSGAVHRGRSPLAAPPLSCRVQQQV